MHGGGGWAAAAANQYASSDLIETQSDGSAAASLTVPNNVAGAIIGKGGNRIRNVRRDSGAEVTIDNTEAGGDRTILIRGGHPQVQAALSMLQRSIAENSR